MKKHLLGTTALVAAGMFAMADTASAQTKVGPVQVSVGGYYAEYVSYTSQDDVGATTTGGSRQADAVRPVLGQGNPLQRPHDSRQRPDGRFPRRARGERRGRPDRRIVHVRRGPLRPLRTGRDQQRPVPHGLQRARGSDAPVVERRQHLQRAGQPDRLARLRLDTFGTTRSRFHDNDSEKINYYTPRFAGFQFGASYIPNSSQDRNGAPEPISTAYSQGYAFGANFVRTFGAFDIAASAGYMAVAGPADERDNQRSGSGPVERRPAARLRRVQDRRQLRRDQRRPPGRVGHDRCSIDGRHRAQLGRKVALTTSA